MNETKWRMHWRREDGSVDRSVLAWDLEAAKRSIDYWNGQGGLGKEYWLQPDGTEPALKAGNGAIVWRMHWKRPCGQLSSADYYWISRDDAQKRADLLNSRTPEIVHWVQPEPAEAVNPEPKPCWAMANMEPISLVIPGYFRLPLYDGFTPPKPAPLWQIMVQNVRGSSDKRPKANDCCKPCPRAEAEQLANDRNLEQQRNQPHQYEWRYWAEPVGEVAEALYQIWCRHTLNPGKPDTPCGVSLDLAAATAKVESLNATQESWAYFSLPDGEKPEPPKPYERRWKFHDLGTGTAIDFHRVKFLKSDTKATHVCEIATPKTFDEGVKIVNRLMAMEPRMADQEIDRIYAEQK